MCSINCSGGCPECDPQSHIKDLETENTKTSELIGPTLGLAVMKCEGIKYMPDPILA